MKADGFRWLLAGALVALLAGCSWSDVLVSEMKKLPPDASFGYQQGYEDGCKSGIARTGGIGFDRPKARLRDEARVASEPDYAKAWDEGERQCADRYAGPLLVRRGYY
jgi:hypothetical protein